MRACGRAGVRMMLRGKVDELVYQFVAWIVGIGRAGIAGVEREVSRGWVGVHNCVGVAGY